MILSKFKKLGLDQQASYLEQLDKMYYDESISEVGDTIYDELKTHYLKAANLEEYSYVPGGTVDGFVKVTHTHPILSLDKVKKDNDLEAELLRLAPGLIQPKVDGVAVVLYPGGKCVSRGTGKIGDDITETVMLIPGIPPKERWPNYPVRIEVVMHEEDFNKLNEERTKLGLKLYQNSRNAASGMLRNIKDLSKVKGISYIAYNLLGTRFAESTQIEILRSKGFNTPTMFPYCSKTVKSAIKYCKTFDRQALPYTIDGLVIKNNDVDSLSKFGQTDHHPKNMVAYKFQSEGAWTYLQRVEESIGREKVTPVGILAPVKLFGATVTRANLHNWGIIKELGGISKHCKVYVVRSNDVIPDITAVSEFNPKFAFKPPTVCPSCKSELYKIKDQLFCPNSQCKGKLVNNIFHMGCREALNIEDLGEETCGKLVEKGLVNSIFDLFKLTEANILSLDGFASKSANNLFTAIQGSRNTTLPRFIYALGISIVGRSVSEKIAKAVLTYEDLIKDLYGGMKVINAIEGIGPSIIANLALNRDFFKELRKYVTPSQYVPIATAVPEKQLTIVITGTLSNSRKYYEDIVIKAGHKLASSVSKSTSILLAGKDAGSKLTKAEDLGITVVDEKTFLDQF